MSDTPTPHAGEADDRRDRALLDAARRGDSSALTSLLDRYQHRVYSLCYRMTGQREWAADLAQDALLKVLAGLDTFDGRSRLSTWIIRVTMNVVLSAKRAQKHRSHLSLDAVSESGESGHKKTPVDARTSPAGDFGREQTSPDRVQHSEARERLAAALLRLSDEHRAILLLRDARGLEYEQIAEVLGIPPGTVKSRLFRARATLREILGEHDRSASS